LAAFEAWLVLYL